MIQLIDKSNSNLTKSFFRKESMKEWSLRKCRFLQYAAVLYLLIEQAGIDETDNL